MFNIDERLEIDIVMDVTTNTLRKGNQPGPCVELFIKLMRDLS